jgi:hypothetical protein
MVSGFYYFLWFWVSENERTQRFQGLYSWKTSDGKEKNERKGLE